MEINLGDFEKIKFMVDELEKSLNHYYEEIKNPNCDEHHLEFTNANIDPFLSWTSIISISSLLGYYGNSSCQKVINVGNSIIFTKYFLLYLNKNRDKIFQEIIGDAIKDLKNLSEGAIKKLDEAKIEIQNLCIRKE